jgi:uncharacterized UBP type Zn finger protein
MNGHSGTGKEDRCEHFAGIDESKITPSTKSCQECVIEGTDWVALRMCLTCGNVGCCDSSEGLHATKHFERTGHPVMVAVPNSGDGATFIKAIHETSLTSYMINGFDIRPKLSVSRCR